MLRRRPSSSSFTSFFLYLRLGSLFFVLREGSERPLTPLLPCERKEAKPESCAGKNRSEPVFSLIAKKLRFIMRKELLFDRAFLFLLLCCRGVVNSYLCEFNRTHREFCALHTTHKRQKNRPTDRMHELYLYIVCTISVHLCRTNQRVKVWEKGDKTFYDLVKLTWTHISGSCCRRFMH